MQGSRCEKATDRDLSVGHIQMQFVAHPGFPIPLAVLLAAHIAFPRQIRQQFLQRHAGLPLQPRRFRGRRRRAVLRPSPAGGPAGQALPQPACAEVFRGFQFPWNPARDDRSAALPASLRGADPADVGAVRLRRTRQRREKTAIPAESRGDSPNRKCDAMKCRPTGAPATAAWCSCYTPLWPQRTGLWPADPWLACPRRPPSRRSSPRSESCSTAPPVADVSPSTAPTPPPASGTKLLAAPA